jgi:hypothetical protein
MEIHAASKRPWRLPAECCCKLWHEFGLPCVHLLVEQLSIAHRPLVKSEPFDIHWIPDRLFREGFLVQVFSEVHPRHEVQEMLFSDRVARFEI